MHPEPVRIQLSRQRGFDFQKVSRSTNGLPAVVVARPSIYGNPFTVKAALEAGNKDGHARAVWAFGEWLKREGDTPWRRTDPERRERLLASLHRLKGHNLACWCPVRLPNGTACPCHGNLLLNLANPGLSTYDQAVAFVRKLNPPQPRREIWEAVVRRGWGFRNDPTGGVA